MIVGVVDGHADRMVVRGRDLALSCQLRRFEDGPECSLGLRARVLGNERREVIGVPSVDEGTGRGALPLRSLLNGSFDDERPPAEAGPFAAGCLAEPHARAFLPRIEGFVRQVIELRLRSMSLGAEDDTAG